MMMTMIDWKCNNCRGWVHHQPWLLIYPFRLSVCHSSKIKSFVYCRYSRCGAKWKRQWQDGEPPPASSPGEGSRGGSVNRIWHHLLPPSVLPSVRLGGCRRSQHVDLHTAEMADWYLICDSGEAQAMMDVYLMGPSASALVNPNGWHNIYHVAEGADEATRFSVRIPAAESMKSGSVKCRFDCWCVAWRRWRFSQMVVRKQQVYRWWMVKSLDLRLVKNRVDRKQVLGS